MSVTTFLKQIWSSIDKRRGWILFLNCANTVVIPTRPRGASAFCLSASKTIIRLEKRDFVSNTKFHQQRSMQQLFFLPPFYVAWNVLLRVGSIA